MSAVTPEGGQEEMIAPGRREVRAAGAPSSSGAFFSPVFYFVFLCFDSSQRTTHLVIISSVRPGS